MSLPMCSVMGSSVLPLVHLVAVPANRSTISLHNHYSTIHFPSKTRAYIPSKVRRVCMASERSSNSVTIGTEGVVHEESRGKTENMSKAVVVGAGPAGCVMALCLLQRGFQVQVFERRQKMKESSFKGDARSYPILLTSRGLKVIEEVGVDLPPNILKPQVGNCVHLEDGKKIKMDYYSGPGARSLIASRNALVAYLQMVLLQRTSKNLNLHFGWELSSIDDTKKLAKFSCSQKYVFEAQVNVEETENEIEVDFDLLVGADGVSSKVRSELLRLDTINSSTSENSKNQHITFNYTENPRYYKSFYVSPSLAKNSRFIADHDRVQAWRSLNIMLINVADESFWGGSINQDLVNASSPAEVEKMFRENAPDLYDLVLQENCNFAEEFVKQEPMKGPGAVMLSKFNYKNIVLLGDAAHGMFPTYGTGCNAALEDCFVFNKILKELTPSDGGQIPYELATEEFTRRRIKDAHAIVEMNTQFSFLPRTALERIQALFLKTLNKLLPSLFGPPAYELLWTETPFSEIQAQQRRQPVIFYSILAVMCLVAILVVRLVLKR